MEPWVIFVAVSSLMALAVLALCVSVIVGEIVDLPEYRG